MGSASNPKTIHPGTGRGHARGHRTQRDTSPRLEVAMSKDGSTGEDVTPREGDDDKNEVAKE